MRVYACRRGGKCVICGNTYLAGSPVSRFPGGRAHPECATGVERVWSTAGCPALTKEGRPCPIEPSTPGRPCHLHDPAGEFARQHPAYRQNLYRRMRESSGVGSF